MGRTPEEIKQLVSDAVKAVEEANVPDDLRVAAFERAFDALTAKPGMNLDTFLGKPKDPEPLVGDGPSLHAIAAKLGLDPELVGELFYVDGDSLGLAVAASKLSTKKAQATQQLALLVAGGRQAGGWDEWTSTSRIRDVTREYGRFDPANFATTVKRMGDVFSFRGRGREVEVRLTRPGYEKAAALARDLGGE